MPRKPVAPVKNTAPSASSTTLPQACPPEQHQPSAGHAGARRAIMAPASLHRTNTSRNLRANPGQRTARCALRFSSSGCLSAPGGAKLLRLRRIGGGADIALRLDREIDLRSVYGNLRGRLDTEAD